MERIPLAIIETPYAATDPLQLEANIAFARACMKDSLLRGEAPYLSHLLYPAVLNDALLEERQLGISAGHAWLRAADLVAVYTDRGVSAGMEQGIRAAGQWSVRIEYRKLGRPA